MVTIYCFHCYCNICCFHMFPWVFIFYLSYAFYGWAGFTSPDDGLKLVARYKLWGLGLVTNCYLYKLLVVVKMECLEIKKCLLKPQYVLVQWCKNLDLNLSLCQCWTFGALCRVGFEMQWSVWCVISSIKCKARGLDAWQRQ